LTCDPSVTRGVITDKVNEMWGTELTQTITIREGRTNVFVAVEHANSEVVGIHASLTLGLSHEGGRSFDPQAFDFVLEITGHVVGAMIVTQLQSTRHTGRDGSEAAMHALAHRLQGLEAIGRPASQSASSEP
jgi:hypothetical protein